MFFDPYNRFPQATCVPGGTVQPTTVVQQGYEACEIDQEGDDIGEDGEDDDIREF